MLIIVDRDRGRDPDAVARRQPAPPPSSPPARPTTLWVVATVLTLVGSGVAMGRIAGFDFSLGLGQLRAAEPEVRLEHQLPYGKGMWIWQPDKTEGGNVQAIVKKAKAVGLSHLYVRTGSSWDGFYAGPFLDKILPEAHEAGIRVYGWDFPRLMDVDSDVQRAVAAIRHESPKGHRIDGFAADIETRSEGTAITAEAATAYGAGLRTATGDGYPLVAVVPRPSPWTSSFYPYAEVVGSFDAVAPMVYWLNRYPGPDVEGALRDLGPLGKPVFPVGQAYDGAPEGGRAGVPPREELLTFVEVAHGNGADGVSFWSWQAADDQAWDAIRDAPQFKLATAKAARPAPREVPRGRSVVLQAG